jgi:hypothetical protein
MIRLGYELGTGYAVEIPLGHLAITGQSQASGKTTTLEGLVRRAGCRAVAFLTKRGEGSFRVKTMIPAYFKERADWRFISSVLEALVGEKLKGERPEIVKLCQDYAGKEGTWRAPHSLADVQRNAEIAIAKARGYSASIYTVLVQYLSEVVPAIGVIEHRQFAMQPGLNVMDLTFYEFAVQALVVRSVIEWIHHNADNTIIVIPEAWKFAPKQRGSPVRLAAEEFIRQGAGLKNFLWCDSQDLAGISSVLLRQVTVWLFGVQRDPREIERTLEHIPADTAKPTKRDIATLGKGQFIVCFEREMYRVYVQPAWMSAAHAEAIARGEEPVESARMIARDFDLEHSTEVAE